MAQLVECAWTVDAAVAVHMAQRFSGPEVREALCALVLERTPECTSVPEAVQYLLTEANIAANVPQLQLLPQWRNCAAKDALRVLLGRFGGHVLVTR